MSDPFIGEIKLVPWSFAPRGWALCNGATLSIAQNQALFSLLGTAFGGDGVRNFKLPDLQGRSAASAGNQFVFGTQVGEPTHTLAANEVPQHVHQMYATATNGTVPTTAAAQWLGSYPNGYGPLPATGATTMSPSTIGTVGANQAHENRQPWLCMNYVIATAGIWPSRN